MSAVERLLGVYHADGGLVGELRYAWAKIVRHEHCELCDLTHAGVRRRPEWDALVSRLGVAFDLAHLNERSERVSALTAGRTPAVLAQVDGAWQLLLDRADLDPLSGDLAAFDRTLRAALADRGLALPPG